MMKRVWPFILLWVNLLFASQVLASVWYVDSAAPAGGTGMSWGSAFRTIQQAVDAAAPGDEAWVKQGTYLLSTEILVDERVSLYGGFSGTETSRSQRNWTQNVTTIDGNNTCRCLSVTANQVTVDGFILTRGRTTGLDKGAGLSNSVAGTTTNTTVRNCKFLNNHSTENSGGGLFNDRGHVTVSGCTFQGNTANNRGGAAYIYYNSSSAFGTATIANCDFIENTAGSGGAVFFKEGSPGPNSVSFCTFLRNNAYSTGGNNDGGAIVCDPTTTITGCTFQDNTATRYGTVATFGDAGTTITVTGCFFAGNEAQYGGGICVNGTSGDMGSLIITNCTFSGNVASGGGGAIYNRKAVGGASQFAVTNSILWGDTAPEIGGTGGAPTVSYSDVQGGYSGTGNINANPLFVSATNLHLTGTSPCIDVGTNAALSIPLQDIDGEARIMDGDENGSYIVDMGADEVTGPTPPTPGWGAAAIIPPSESGGGGIAHCVIWNALGMVLVPLGALAAVAGLRRRR